MNDLISRSEVLKTLEKVFDKYGMKWNPKENEGFSSAVPNAIKEIPTAYDMNKVVVELEKLKQNQIHLLCEHKSHIDDIQAMRSHNVLVDTINIVKADGVDD